MFPNFNCFFICRSPQAVAVKVKEKRKEKQVEGNVELEEDEALMEKMLGFSTFNTTKVG